MLDKARISMMLVLAAGLGVSSLASAQPGTQGPAPMVSPTGEQPKAKSGIMVFEREQIDFGKVNDVDLQQGEFKFTNRGDGPLEIIDIKGSCSCTVGELDKMVYAPGESGTLSVTLNTARRDGTMGQTVTVQTNDETAPLRTLIVRANVIPLATVSAKEVQFGELDKGQVATQEFVVTGPDEEFAVTSVRTDRPDAFAAEVVKSESVEVEDRMNGGKKMATQTTIRVTTLPDAPVGPRLRSTVFIATNHKKVGTKTIFGTVSIRGDLVLEPSRFTFGVLKPGEEFSGSIRVRSKSGESFEISNAVPVLPVGRPMQDSMNVSIEAAADGDGYVVTISGKAPDEAMPARGYVLINTNVAGESVQRAGLSAVVRTPRATSNSLNGAGRR